MRNYSVKNTMWENKGHEFDKVAENIFSLDMRYYIYGDESENNKLLEQVKDREIIVAERIEEIAAKECIIGICTG